MINMIIKHKLKYYARKRNIQNIKKVEAPPNYKHIPMFYCGMPFGGGIGTQSNKQTNKRKNKNE